jgi:hypothetical protein
VRGERDRRAREERRERGERERRERDTHHALAALGVNTIHAGKELVEGLFAFIMCRIPPATHPAHRCTLTHLALMVFGSPLLPLCHRHPCAHTHSYAHTSVRT